MPASLRSVCSPRLLSKPRSRPHPGSYLFRSYKNRNISANLYSFGLHFHFLSLSRTFHCPLSRNPCELSTISMVLLPFKSSLCMWVLSLTAWATTSAASIVISPKERLSSWTEAGRAAVRARAFSTEGGVGGEDSPWWWEVPLWAQRRGRWLLPSGRGSRRSWPPARSSGASGSAGFTNDDLHWSEGHRCFESCAPVRETRPHLCHGQRSLLGECVVVQIEDAELWIVAQGRSQRRHALIVDTVLGHVDFFQAAHQLVGGKNRENFEQSSGPTQQL